VNANRLYFTYKTKDNFILSCFSAEVDPVMGWWHCVKKICIAHTSEILTVPILRQNNYTTVLADTVHIHHFGIKAMDSEKWDT
jgi:hypothetical protein